MSYKELFTRIKHKCKTLEEWEQIQPGQFTLLYGEICYGIDVANNKISIKIGNDPNGEVDFTDLEWMDAETSWDCIKEIPDDLLTRGANTTADLEKEEPDNDAKLPYASAVKNYINKQGFAKADQIPDVSGFLTEIPEEYVTESELEGKGYATKDEIPTIPDMSLYLEKTQRDAENGVAPLDDKKKVPVANLPKLTDSEEVISTISETNHTTDYIPDANAVYNYSQEILDQAKEYVDDQKGQANGIVPLNSSSKIDESYLPSYVDDILEGYYNEGNFYEDSGFSKTIAGESSKVYVDLTNNKIYRWSGSAFVEIPHLPNIVEEITENSTNTEVAGAKAIADYVNYKNPVKEITTTVHVADLEPGIYYVNWETLLPGSGGEIILANIDEKNNKLIEDYLSLKTGYIVVNGRYLETTEEKEACGYSYIAHGYFNVPDYYDDLSGWQDFSYLTSGASEIHCALGYAIKPLQESALDFAVVEGIELNKWYSSLEGLLRSNLTTSNLKDYIDQQGSKFDVPTTKSVYDFAVNNQADYNEWEEDKPSFVKNKPFYSEYIPQGENEILTNNLFFDNNYGQECPMNRDQLTYPLSANDKYNIIVTGTWALENAPDYKYEYRRLEPKFDETSGGYLIGNASLYSSNYEDTGEYVCLLLTQTENDICYTPYWSFDHGTGTLEKLAPEEEIIHHIDQKYLPYYSEYEEQRYLLEPVTLDCQDSVSSDGYTLYINEGQTNEIPLNEFLHLFFEGQKYKVNYDNKYYICEPYISDEDTIALGNLKFLGKEDYSGDEPFGILLVFAEPVDNFLIGYQFASLEQGVHTISIEYPDKDFTIFEDNALELTEDGEGFSIISKDISSRFTCAWSQMSWFIMCENNMECKVTLKGQEYVSRWTSLDDHYLLGNLALINDEIYKDTKENFILMISNEGIINIFTTLPAGTCDLKIEINGYPKREINVEKIPNKYIDIDVPYTTDDKITTFNTDIHFQTRGLIGDTPTADLATILRRTWDEISEQPHLNYGGEYYEVGNSYIREEAKAWSTGALPNGYESWAAGYESWTEGNTQRKRLTEAMYFENAILAVEEINDGKSTVLKNCLEVFVRNTEIDRYLYEINNGVRQLLKIDFKDESGGFYLLKPTSAYLIDSSTLRIEFAFLDNNKFSVELDQNGREINSIQFLGYYGKYAHSQNNGYAMGKNSSAEGEETIALGEDQHVQGHYNELDREGKYAHIVGNGSGLDSRSNAYTLDWEGNGNYSGTVTAKKFIAEEEEAFGKFTDSYFVLNDIGNGLNYAIQMKNGEIISTELPVRIQVKQNPTKTYYYYGEVFDSTGLIIEAVYNDGTTKIIEDFTTDYDNKALESKNGVDITVKAKLPSIFTTTLTVHVSHFNDTSILQDFVYSQPSNYEFQLQGWKETYNGVSSTELIIPDYSVIVP